MQLPQSQCPLGPCLLPTSPSTGTRAWLSVSGRLGEDILGCIRSKSAKEIQKVNKDSPYPRNLEAPLYKWSPVMDGDFIPDVIYTLFEQGKFIKGPTITGDTTNGGTSFTSPNTSTLAQSNDFSKHSSRSPRWPNQTGSTTSGLTRTTAVPFGAATLDMSAMSTTTCDTCVPAYTSPTSYTTTTFPYPGTTGTTSKALSKWSWASASRTTWKQWLFSTLPANSRLGATSKTKSTSAPSRSSRDTGQASSHLTIPAGTASMKAPSGRSGGVWKCCVLDYLVSLQ